MNLKCKSFCIVMALVMVLSSFVMAQTSPADNMQFVIEKIRADKKLLIAENMQLTEDEAKEFWPIYENYQHELFLLRARTKKLIEDYAEAYDDMDNKTAKMLLDEYVTIEDLKLKLRSVYLPKFRAVLSDIKVVRYYQLENKINTALMYEIGAQVPLIKGPN